MFTGADRERVRELLLARAHADDDITGAAFTGSTATGDNDRWSDTDLALAVRDSELLRALASAVGVAADELARSDPALAGRLRPMLAELA